MNLEKPQNHLDNNYGDEIDLIDVLRFIFQERKNLILGAFAGALVAILLTVILTKKTESYSTVKIDTEKSLAQISLETLKASLANASANSQFVADGIEYALKNSPEFQNIFSEKGFSSEAIAEAMAGKKVGDRILDIDAGATPSVFRLKVSLPKELAGLDTEELGLLILNGIVQSYNEDSREQQAAQDHIRATMAPTAYTVALDNFTTISGNLANLEVKLLELAPESVVKHVQSPGFAPGADPLEAQFARVRFLIGAAEGKGKIKVEERKQIQKKFLDLQDSLGAAQLELTVAAEAKKELLRKNLPLIQRDPLPLFQGVAPTAKSQSNMQAVYKNQILGGIAGAILGMILTMILILARRFFKENWLKITNQRMPE